MLISRYCRRTPWFQRMLAERYPRCRGLIGFRGPDQVATLSGESCRKSPPRVGWLSAPPAAARSWQRFGSQSVAGLNRAAMRTFLASALRAVSLFLEKRFELALAASICRRPNRYQLSAVRAGRADRSRCPRCHGRRRERPAGDRATASAAAIRANKSQPDLAERGHCDNVQRRRAGAPAGAATRRSVV